MCVSVNIRFEVLVGQSSVNFSDRLKLVREKCANSTKSRRFVSVLLNSVSSTTCVFWGTHIVTKRSVVDLLHLCCRIVVRSEVKAWFRFGFTFGAVRSLRAPFECAKFLSSPSRLRFCLSCKLQYLCRF